MACRQQSGRARLCRSVEEPGARRAGSTAVAKGVEGVNKVAMKARVVELVVDAAESAVVASSLRPEPAAAATGG